jgi:hypothetical protein
MARLAMLNGARIALMLFLHALLYWTAIPDPPLSAWLIFIALQLVLGRIPFVPNLDIVFLTAAIHLAGSVGASEARIAGMLVAEAGLMQAFNVAMFAATAHLALGVRPPRSAPGQEQVSRAPAREACSRLKD